MNAKSGSTNYSKQNREKRPKFALSTSECETSSRLIYIPLESQGQTKIFEEILSQIQYRL